MKKLFFFFAAALFSISVLSCSSDDDDIISEEIPKTGENKGTLTVTIDGILTTFNTVIVNEARDGEYSILKVVATQDNNPNKVIIFEVIKGNIGMNYLNPFTYVRDDLSYVSDYYPGIKAVLKVNNTNKLN